MKTKNILTASALALSVAVTAIPVLPVSAENTGYDIYVSVSGDDATGNGTADKPYASIEKARDAAREKSKSADDPVTVYVDGGKYFIDERIEFNASDSNVHYKASEDTVLTGAKTLSNLNWTDYSGNSAVKVADVDKNLGIDQLFIDGEQQILARYPNYNASQSLQGSTSQADIKARSESWSNPAGGYIRALHNLKWGGNSYKITGKNASSSVGVNYEWIGDNNRGSGMHSDYVMVENIFEELDSPGEWYYDNTEGKLYVYPQEGTNLDQNSQVEAAVTEEIFHIEGKQDGEQVTNLTFDGFTLENTKRTMFTGEYVPLMRSDWCVVRSGAVFIQDGEDITFQNGTLRNIGGNGIFLSGHSKNVVIDNNEIINIGSSGVLAAGFPDSCREASFWEYSDPLQPETNEKYVHKTTIDDTTAGPIAEHYPESAVISNNHIQNVGIWEKQSSHVALSVAHKIQILHNTIHEGPRAGVNVGDGTFGGHEIAYNDIFDVQKETDDHGMFNSWGRDRFWSLGGYDTMGNNGAAKEEYSLLDVIDTIKIHDNRMHFGGRVDGGSTFGIDLDDGSTNYEIYNNLCLNMGIKLREGFHRNVYNNILVNGQFNLHCTFEDSYDTIERNIVIKGSPYNLAATDESRFAVSEDVIDKNWFYDLGMTVNMPGDYWKNNLNYDVNSVTADPQFKDPGSNDYTVQNETIMEQIGFENFPMDQFGKPGCEYQAPVYEKTEPDGNVDILQREDWLGATISALDDAIMSSTGAGGLDGVYLESVPEESLAAQYGFQSNDVLKELNGEIIGEKASFTEKYNAIKVGTTVTFKIRRNQLWEEVSYIKQDKETTIDDQNSSIIYNGGNWDESTPDHNGINSVNCIEQTMTYKQVSDENRADATVEVPFTGNQIEFFSRVENNMGNYRITIADSEGKTVQEEECSANNADKLDAVSIFKSEMLPYGSYKLTLQCISGDYIIVDAFKVLAVLEEDTLDKTVLENAVQACENELEKAGRYTASTWFPFYEAYHAALAGMENETIKQWDIERLAETLLAAKDSLELLEVSETVEFSPSSSTREQFEIYRNDDTQDGGNRDGKTGDQWQVRPNQSDATVNGAYAEFEGNITSFQIFGANKSDSANFRVVITDEDGDVITEEAITQTKNQGENTVQIYSISDLDDSFKSIKVYHNDNDSLYLELRKIAYTVHKSSTDRVPELTGVEVKQLPDKVTYQIGESDTISLAGGVITETYSDGKEIDLPMSSSMYSGGFDTDSIGEKEITVVSNGKTATFKINVVEADKEALQKEIEAAKEILKSDTLNRDYEAAAIEKVKEALKEAESVSEDPNAVVETIENAQKTLSEAVDALQKAKKDWSELEKLLTEGKEILEKIETGAYTEETASVYKNAYEAAQNLTDEATQTSINEVVDALQKAKDALRLIDGSSGEGEGDKESGDGKPTDQNTSSSAAGGSHNSTSSSAAGGSHNNISDIVQTGDSSNPIGWIVLAILAVLMSIGVLCLKKFKK